MNDDECLELNRLIDEYGERVGHLTRRLTALRQVSGPQADVARLDVELARIHAETAWVALERHVAEHHPERVWSQLGVQPLPDGTSGVDLA